MAEKARVLIFIVSYNAEKHIHKVLERVPGSLWDHPAFSMDILIIDDESKDRTYREVADLSAAFCARATKIPSFIPS